MILRVGFPAILWIAIAGSKPVQVAVALANITGDGLNLTANRTFRSFWDIPLCDSQLEDALGRGDALEVDRYSIFNTSLDCRTHTEYPLQLALRSGSESLAMKFDTASASGAPELFVRNGSGATPIQIAADQRFSGVVAAMLQKGASVADTDNYNHTLLHFAVASPATTALLIDRIPFLAEALAAVDAHGKQPLHYAVSLGQPDVVQQLLQAASERVSRNFAAALAEAPDGAGNRPVHLCGDARVFRTLLQFGASVAELNSMGASPFHTAAAIPGSAANGALDLLLSEVDGFFNVVDHARQTLLHYASASGEAENVAWLLDQGADADATDANGDLPLTVGLRKGHWHLLQTFQQRRGTTLEAVAQSGELGKLQDLLFSRREHVSSANPRTGRTAVYGAVAVGRLDMIDYLLNLGLSITGVDYLGWSILSTAVVRVQAETVEYLLQRGAPVNQRLQNMSSALHVAAAVGEAETVKVLLRYGANIEALDSLGRTALHLASTGAVVKVLMQNGAKWSRSTDGLSPAHSVALAGHSSALEAMLTLRVADADDRTPRGDTPLHLAARGGNSDAARTLLVWCADVSVRNQAGRLPHQEAATLDLAALLQDAAYTERRCHCDCGPYELDPLYVTVAWGSLCNGTVRCRLQGSDSLEEPVQCLSGSFDSALSTASSSAWSPARPTILCEEPSSAGPQLAVSLSVAWTLLSFCALAKWPAS